MTRRNKWKDSRAPQVDGLLDAKWVGMAGETRIVNDEVLRFIRKSCSPKEKCVPSPPRDRLSVGKRVLRNNARYRSYGEGCALFCLDTNRLLKISGRSLKERENKPSKRERRKRRRWGGRPYVELYSIRSSSRESSCSMIRFPSLPGRHTNE